MDWYNADLSKSMPQTGRIAESNASNWHMHNQILQAAMPPPEDISLAVEGRVSGALVKTRGILRPYFCVSHSYVCKKLGLLMFPFVRVEDSARSSLGITGVWSNENDTSQSFERSLGAYDLYIPLISFITYVLLYAATLGIKGRFKPTVLSDRLSFGMLVSGIEALVLYGSRACLDIENNSFLDCLATVTYKYLNLSILLLVNLIIDAGSWQRLILFSIVSLTAAYSLMSMAMGWWIFSGDWIGGRNSSRVYLATAFAVLQAFLIYLLIPHRF